MSAKAIKELPHPLDDEFVSNFVLPGIFPCNWFSFVYNVNMPTLQLTTKNCTKLYSIHEFIELHAADTWTMSIHIPNITCELQQSLLGTEIFA